MYHKLNHELIRRWEIAPDGKLAVNMRLWIFIVTRRNAMVRYLSMKRNREHVLGEGNILLASSFLILLMNACVSEVKRVSSNETDASAGDHQRAQESLRLFFDYLHEGDYTEAIDLYGGSYATLVEYNPTIDPEDRPALLEAACRVNGFQCVSVRKTLLLEQPSPTEYLVVVEFENDDGSLFIRGRCCESSGNEEEPPASQFVFRISKEADGSFIVLDLPVYIP
jgi:hypothetical protein